VNKLSASTDSVSKYVWSQFSASSRQLLTDATVSSKQRQTALVMELNNIVQSASLYDSARFVSVNLSEETLRLSADNLQGRDLTLFNRSLLSDVFAAQIIKRSAFPTNYLNIVAPIGSAGFVSLDGVVLPAATFSPIPGGLFVGTQVKVSSGLHRVSSPAPVSVIGYGWGEYDAYGWPACFALGDTQPPHVTGPPDFAVTVYNSAASQGCTTTVPDMRGKVTVEDNCETSPNSVVRQDPEPGTQVGVGVHRILFSANDAAGNMGYGETIMTVIGGGEPTLVIPTNITVNAQSPEGVRVNFEAIAVRPCGDTTPLICEPPSGSLFPPGKTTVKCHLADPQYPLASSFEIIVVYATQKINFTYSPKSHELVLLWDSSATLQRADRLLGPWTDIPNAASSYRVFTSENRMSFYRLKP
jgi:hypothetical protein